VGSFFSVISELITDTAFPIKMKYNRMWYWRPPTDSWLHEKLFR